MTEGPDIFTAVTGAHPVRDHPPKSNFRLATGECGSCHAKSRVAREIVDRDGQA